jgi:hypothetical protein
MKYPKYPIVANDNKMMYEFFSEGPKGKIKKVVLYTQIHDNVFNLGFGDWNEERQEPDDSSRSNNGDRDQVLATVAFTALDFLKQNPFVDLFLEGSTSGRTRLYQMGIGDNLMEINEEFWVKGFNGEKWELFERGRNYEAFLITKK